jgi:hypothetical protein
MTTSPPGSSWYQPADSWLSVEEFKSGLVVIHVSDWIGSGTLEIKLQSAVYAARDDYAWVDVADLTGITAAGSYLVASRLSASLTGLLRIKAICTISTISFNLRAEAVLKDSCESRVLDWLAPTTLSLAASTWTMDADLYADCSSFLNCYALVEFLGTSTGTLTATFQTAPSRSSDSSAWKDVASSTISNTAVQLNGEISATVPPMGIVRMKFDNAGGTTTGSFRVTLLMKET